MYSLFSGSSLARTRIDRAHSIAVCLPALNEEATIGYICESIDTQLRKDSSLVDDSSWWAAAQRTQPASGREPPGPPSCRPEP